MHRKVWEYIGMILRIYNNDSIVMFCGREWKGMEQLKSNEIIVMQALGRVMTYMGRKEGL